MDLCEIEARVSSRKARATQRNPLNPALPSEELNLAEEAFQMEESACKEKSLNPRDEEVAKELG